MGFAFLLEARQCVDRGLYLPPSFFDPVGPFPLPNPVLLLYNPPEVRNLEITRGMISMILVTNDDGVYSPGIQVLAKRLRELDTVVIVAPDRERSAAGHSMTLHRPLLIEEIKESVYSVNGTPTDCVNMAVKGLAEGNAAARGVRHQQGTEPGRRCHVFRHGCGGDRRPSARDPFLCHIA